MVDPIDLARVGLPSTPFSSGVVGGGLLLCHAPTTAPAPVPPPAAAAVVALLFPFKPPPFIIFRCGLPVSPYTSAAARAGVLPKLSGNRQKGIIAGELSTIWLVGSFAVVGSGMLRLWTRGAGVLMLAK